MAIHPLNHFQDQLTQLLDLLLLHSHLCVEVLQWHQAVQIIQQEQVQCHHQQQLLSQVCQEDILKIIRTQYRIEPLSPKYHKSHEALSQICLSQMQVKFPIIFLHNNLLIISLNSRQIWHQVFVIFNC